MPLDYEALVAPFRTAYFLQRRSIGESLRRMAEWLTKRLKETEERERATRAFQIFGFNDSALSVWIDTSQHGALGVEGTPPPDGFWQTAAAPFVAFWRGLLVARSMIEAEGALPDILDTLARTLKLIIDSLDRFKTPEKSLFDLTIRKRWDDLIGEVGLFFRLINDPATVEKVKTFSEGGIELIAVLRKHFPKSEKETKAGGGGLADIARWIFGATLAIPIAWQLLTQIARTANLVIRLGLLEWATSIQNAVFDLRRDAIDFFYVTLWGTGSAALHWLFTTQHDVLLAIDLYTGFITTYFGEFETWLTTTAKELKTFADDLLRFIRGLGDYFETFMDIDFGAAVSFGLISFSLNDILEWREDPSKAEALQEQIDELLESALLMQLLRKRLLALREVIGIAATWTPFPAEAAPPDLSGITFPNIYEAFFGKPEAAAPEAAALRAQLASAGPTLTTNLETIFNTAITALTDVAEKMGQAGTAAVRLGSAARYAQVAEQASELAETAFGADAARAGLVRRKDPIGAAFESWLAGSGFAVIGKALPKYVAEMIEFWRREASKPPEERPTSPHITARRAQVDRVRTPRMVIRVLDERELDKVLAVEIADRTGIGVARAYQLAIAQPGAAG